MADPLSVVGMVTTIADITKLIFYNARVKGRPSNQLGKTISEMQILVAIFFDAAEMLDSLTTAAPASAGIALQTCEELVKHLQSTMKRYSGRYDGGTATTAVKRIATSVVWTLRDGDDIRNDVAAFRTAVTLLREIANDAMTHDLIRSQLYVSSVTPKRQMKSAGSSAIASAADSDSEADVVEATNSYQNTWREKFSMRGGDIYLQYGTISLAVPDSKEALWQPVKIKFDSGSDFNLVSREVLDMMNFSGPFEEPKPVKATTVDGKAHEMTDRVTLSWQLHKSLKTLRTRFYIVEDAPFDLLIGKSLTAGQDLPRHSRNFLLRLRMPRLSKEERERTDRKTKEREQEAEAAALAEQQANALSATPTPAKQTVSASTAVSSNAASRTSLGP